MSLEGKLTRFSPGDLIHLNGQHMGDVIGFIVSLNNYEITLSMQTAKADREARMQTYSLSDFSYFNRMRLPMGMPLFPEYQ